MLQMPVIVAYICCNMCDPYSFMDYFWVCEQNDIYKSWTYSGFSTQNRGTAYKALKITCVFKVLAN